jgi:hypothetical protein
MSGKKVVDESSPDVDGSIPEEAGQPGKERVEPYLLSKSIMVFSHFGSRLLMLNPAASR